MVGLVVALLFLLALVIVPLMLVGLAVRLAVALLLLPFRLVGLAVRVAVGLAAALAGVAVGGVVLVAVLAAAGIVLLLPLLPFLLLGGGLWLIWRLARKPAGVQPGF